MQTDKKFSVIMVDDEIWALRGLQGIIDWNSFGFEIKGAFTDARKALSLIEETSPDVIFTDIRMPDIDGIELIKKVREFNKEAHIVIVTAYEDFEIARMAIKSNVSDYLIKPLNREDVKNTATMLFDKLATQKSSSVSISDFDLLSKETCELVEVQRLLEGVLAPDMCIAVSSSPLCASSFVPLRISDYSYAGLVPRASLPELNSSKTSYGLSMPVVKASHLYESVLEAVMSFEGKFFFSDCEQIRKIQKYLYENMDKKLSLEDVAGHFFLSKSYVHELFRNNTDTSAMCFLKDLRLTKAASLLTKKSGSVREIAALVGYEDPGYFSRQFKVKYGCTPEKYAAGNN